ncbi:hypothetical protein FA15DRAFT_428972 [Coprinopsis marcescibilis]|uniref:Uncharacterized protein n=1 Tax=Coprinopsis marcescibilis TaxID=230819 RepID=A0A5C3L809_COPMA|nr:hypothetical protein FA15DRAFT_428972 [Coprinopsis marcescibilis]
MAAFHLRPVSVSDVSPSPSPTASTSTPDDHHGPAYNKSSTAIRPSPPPSANGRARRTLSPGFHLRDLDLTHNNDMGPRKYPTPPTGHDLMAMFPPAPPDNFPELRSGPTSGYFQRQERAFFAQAGREIVRVRVEVDLPHGSGSSRPWPPPATSSSTPPSASASQSPNMPSAAAPVLYPHPANRPSPRNGISSQPPLYPLSTNHPHPHSHHGPPTNLHATGPLHQNTSDSRTPPQNPSQIPPNGKVGEFSPEDYDDEMWRPPMPYSERRRAGKHTKRVIVRS